MSGTALIGDIILASALGIILLLEVRKHRDGGQALVEFALVLPIMLFVVLGSLEAGFLLATYADQGRHTGTLAQWAAYHPADVPGPSWAALTASEAPGCTVTESVDALDVVTVASTCHYTPKVTDGLGWSGLPITTTATGAIAPTVSPSPEASL